jgi:hypothetical protein
MKLELCGDNLDIQLSHGRTPWLWRDFGGLVFVGDDGPLLARFTVESVEKVRDDPPHLVSDVDG